jgi:sporulation protein YlmC with PRC-barrel domain
MTEHNGNRGVLSATTLIGDEVKNTIGETLGELEEIMIDMEEGRIAYAVLSFGGFLGMGDKLFAIPWEALQVDTNDKKIVFDVPKERLQNAPGFDKDNWPRTTDRKWMTEVHSYYGYDPYWQ